MIRIYNTMSKRKEDFVPQLLGPKGLDKCPHLGFPPIIN